MWKPIWNQAKVAVLFVIGVVFIIFGVLGLFLPILQGILFLTIGICILAIISPSFKHRLYHLLNPYPKARAKVELVFNKIERIFKRKNRK